MTFAAAACSSASGPADAGSTPAVGSGATRSAVAAASADMAKYAQPVMSYAALQPVAGASGLKGKSVWYIPVGASVPVLAAAGPAMAQALGHVGITVHTCDGRFLPTDQAACVNQAIAAGADGVVTGFIDYAALPTSYDELVAHHIPVLAGGVAPSGGKDSTPQLAFYNLAPQTNLSQRLDMDAVIADSGGKANVLYVGAADQPITIAAANYAKNYLTTHCPDCTLNDVSYNTASISKLPSQVNAGLIAHPDTTYVVDEYDAAAALSVEGIQSAGYANKVKLASADGDLDCLQRIKANNVQFVDVGDSPAYMGWQYADGIVRMLLGHTPTLTLGVVRVFTSSSVAGLTLSPAAYSTNAWYGSDAYQQAFLSAWKAS